MTRVKLSRRQFSIGMGASLLAAPFVGLLRGTAAAAANDTARRLVVFFCPNGTIPSRWRPSGSGTSYAFPAGSILEPLTPWRQDLTVIGGLDFVNASNHEGGMAAMLTGQGGAGTESGGMSVDQYVASRIGAQSRFSSLELGVQTSAWGGSVQTRMSYRGPGQYAVPDDRPTNVYSRLFGDLVGDPGEVDAALRRRLSVLDSVRSELSELERQLGVEERPKLEAHLESIRDLERGLGGGGGGGGSCDAPVAVPDSAPYDNDLFPSIGKNQMDLLVTSLACDMTRVASIQWAHTVAPHVFSWVGVNEGHHGLSHMDDGNSAGVADFVKTERWFAEQFGYLLGKLAATPDPVGGGSLLDTSLVVWAKEMGDSRMHVCESVPFVLAGKAGGRFDHGRYLTYDREPHNKLLVSICHAMGLDNTTFGNPSFGTGPLSGLV